MFRNPDEDECSFMEYVTKEKRFPGSKKRITIPKVTTIHEPKLNLYVSRKIPSMNLSQVDSDARTTVAKKNKTQCSSNSKSESNKLIDVTVPFAS